MKKDKNNLYLNLSIIVNLVMVFFGSNITNLYYLQIISVAFALFSIIISRKKLSLRMDTFIWVLFLLFLICNIFISIDLTSSFKQWIMLFLLIIIKIIYENYETNWFDLFISLLFYFGMIHTFATILQFFFPNFIMSINKIILTSDNYATNFNLFSLGGYAGITGQTTVNAFFIAVFILICFINILIKNKKNNFPFLILGILSLLITAKRGLIIFAGLTMLLIYYYISRKDNKNVLKYVLSIIVLFIIVISIFKTIPSTSVVFEKFQRLSQFGDVSNGREILWKKSLDIFKEYPLQGIGISSISNVIGEYTHNVYIQLLAEIGIFGFLIYISCIIIPLFQTFKIISKIDISNKKLLYYCFISLFIQILYMFYSFTGNPFYSHIFITPYIIAISMLVYLRKEAFK